MRRSVLILFTLASVTCIGRGAAASPITLSEISSGSTIYQFLDADSYAVRGELALLDSFSSPNFGWTAPEGDLNSLLTGGLSGIRWDFGAGLEPATAGVFVNGYATYPTPLTLQSRTGRELDVGWYQSDNGVYFGTGFDKVIHTFLFEDSLMGGVPDSVVYGVWDGNWEMGQAFGYWVSSTPATTVPDPGSTLLLFGISLASIAGFVRRRRRR